MEKKNGSDPTQGPGRNMPPAVYRPFRVDSQLKTAALPTPARSGAPPAYCPFGAASILKPAGAPPAYRPSVPAFQLKRVGAPQVYRPTGGAQTGAGAQMKPMASAPPVYRPQPAQVQPERMGATHGAPPVYRPQSPATQAKHTGAGGIHAASHVQGRVAPAPYRPAPRAVVQRMQEMEDWQKEAEKLALRQWKKDVRKISSGHTSSGRLRPEVYESIERGPFRDMHPHDVLWTPMLDPVSSALGLTIEEETALWKYSQGRKDEKDSYGYMSSDTWKDLERAVKKIPSMEELNVVATVFRGDRTTDFADFLTSRVGQPCYIIHGAVIAGSGIHHLASAAFVVNNHGLRALTLVRIECLSARYVQYWGMHGVSLDGGEVLIPAGTITCFDGKPSTQERFGDEVKPVFTLREVSPLGVEPGIPFFDDFKGAAVGAGVIDKLVPGLRARLADKQARLEDKDNWTTYGTFSLKTL